MRACGWAGALEAGDAAAALALLLPYGGQVAAAPGQPGGPAEGEDDEAYAWPHTKMPGQGGVPWMNDRSAAESYLSEHQPKVAAFRQRLYAREKAVHYGVGTALLYHENTWSAPCALCCPLNAC